MNKGYGRRWMVGGLGLALVMCVGAGVYVSKAAATMSSRRPPSAITIATIDLEDVINGLKEREDKEKELTAAGEEAKARLKARAAEIETDKTKLDAQANGPAKITAAKALREKAIRLGDEERNEQRMLTELKADMIRDLYAKITDVARQMAKQEGYQMVLASDQRVPITSTDLEGVTRAIGLKRMIYVEPSLDITQDIVQMLNNQYTTQGTGARAPTPSTAAPKKP